MTTPNMTPPQGGEYNNESTVPIGIDSVFVEKKQFTPIPHVLEYFLSLDEDASTAWIAGGVPLEVGHTMLRMESDWQFIKWGITDAPRLILTSLKIWAGRDRMARDEAKEVAIGAKVPTLMGQVEEIAARQREIQGRTVKP